MTTEASVEETVRKIAARVLRKPDIEFTKGSTFKDFKADSLDIVQILVAIEDTYDIEVPEDELREVSDIEGFIGVIEKTIAAKG